jgi:hypothetical protein
MIVLETRLQMPKSAPMKLLRSNFRSLGNYEYKILLLVNGVSALRQDKDASDTSRL